ncbi:DedA family protein [Effusibacillus lacus]|uniref:Alkaline phosphatase n=1 Tax=Effusibacillus lacus TaxID=1348429 RepID=A0A292YKQ3_9BACL|nr:DedA family protein [Effusibacillus lacus]TCS75321.1 membrane protein DedA with SNARE-associated domain [Effusibacillus lacus]GAX89756.1 alkaline phosphatase [Effusibacillus lacus]
MTIEQTVLELLSVYGYIALFLSLVLGIVGLPIPDEVIMTYVGFLVSQGTMKFSAALFTAFAGSVVGMTISYSLGRYFGFPLIRRFGKHIGIKEAHWQKVQTWYEKFGPFVLMIGYFLPGIRHLTAFSAGTSRMRVISFGMYAYTGGFIWALTFISLGRVLGEHWNLLFVYLHRYGVWILPPLLLLFLGIFLVYRRKKKLS